MNGEHKIGSGGVEVPVLPPGEVLLRLPQVMAATGRGRTSLLDDVAAGRFPRPIKVGAASMWLHSEVQAWIAERVRESRQARGA